MTPFEIDILLHYYAKAEDHPVIASNPPIWAETRDKFLALGLLEPAGEQYLTYRPGKRLIAYAKALEVVPLPEPAWVTHWPTGIKETW